MPYKAGLIGIIAALWMLCVVGTGWAYFNLPPVPPSDEYGSLLIDRLSTKSGKKAVIFSHWRHRAKFTCRVCHSELDFAMKANATPISETASRKGKFCGACHNGKVAFKHAGNCDRCHAGSLSAATKGFAAFAKSVPIRTHYGDGINWVELLNRGAIKPRHYLNMKSGDMQFAKVLSLDAEGNMIPPAIFPHKAHTDWLECNSCHPDIFNIKKKTTQHFSMSSILKGEFCGVCHLRVAFPMNDCRRCHPGMKEQQS